MGLIDKLTKEKKKKNYAYEPMSSDLIEARRNEQMKRLVLARYNIDVFNDTLSRIEKDERLRRLTQTAMERTCIIEEGLASDAREVFPYSRISVEENLTLITALRYADTKKTAVLNVANPVIPGGGVLNGAEAQEEYLCRASNLYCCLTSGNAADYYEVHKSRHPAGNAGGVFLGTDRIIYSPAVTVIKEDTAYIPYDDTRHIGAVDQKYTDDWKTIDVITCAAPIITSTDAMPPEDLIYRIFVKRIRNILEAAIDNEVDVLVLGAFGCGAFHNPPEIVAKAFCDLFMQDRYRYAFPDVIFSIKRTGWNHDNIDIFGRALRPVTCEI